MMAVYFNFIHLCISSMIIFVIINHSHLNFIIRIFLDEGMSCLFKVLVLFDCLVNNILLVDIMIYVCFALGRNLHFWRDFNFL